MSDNGFGKKAVFKRPNYIAVNYQCIKGDGDRLGMNIDMAQNPNNVPAWDTKTTIQLNIDELFLLVAFFLKLEEQANFSYHGKHKNKSMIFIRHVNDDARRTESILMKQMDAGKDAGYIFLTKMEGFRVYKLAMMQLCLYYGQTEREILFSIRQFLGHH